MDARNNTSTLPCSVKQPSQQQLEKAAVLFYLVHECLSLTKDLVRDIERHQKLTLADIERYEIRSIPTELQNIILSHECLLKFGPSVLWSSEMFYSFTRAGRVCNCLDWSNQCCCALETWRLDVRPTYTRGLLLPICDRRYGFFTDLLVYRHCRDERPFVLKLRADQEMAA